MWYRVVSFTNLRHSTHKASVTNVHAEANAHRANWLMSIFVNELALPNALYQQSQCVQQCRTSLTNTLGRPTLMIFCTFRHCLPQEKMIKQCAKSHKTVLKQKDQLKTCHSAVHYKLLTNTNFNPLSNNLHLMNSRDFLYLLVLFPQHRPKGKCVKFSLTNPSQKIITEAPNLVPIGCFLRNMVGK